MHSCPCTKFVNRASERHRISKLRETKSRSGRAVDFIFGLFFSRFVTTISFTIMVKERSSFKISSHQSASSFDKLIRIRKALSRQRWSAVNVG